MCKTMTNSWKLFDAVDNHVEKCAESCAPNVKQKLSKKKIGGIVMKILCKCLFGEGK